MESYNPPFTVGARITGLYLPGLYLPGLYLRSLYLGLHIIHPNRIFIGNNRNIGHVVQAVVHHMLSLLKTGAAHAQQILPALWSVIFWVNSTTYSSPRFTGWISALKVMVLVPVSSVPFFYPL